MLMVQLSATMSMIARATVSTAISTFEYTNVAFENNYQKNACQLPV